MQLVRYLVGTLKHWDPVVFPFPFSLRRGICWAVPIWEVFWILPKSLMHLVGTLKHWDPIDWFCLKGTFCFLLEKPQCLLCCCCFSTAIPSLNINFKHWVFFKIISIIDIINLISSSYPVIYFEIYNKDCFSDDKQMPSSCRQKTTMRWAELLVMSGGRKWWYIAS